MLGCIQPMSSPMMKRMLGLLAGPLACVWAKDGESRAGTIIAVKAAQMSMLSAVLLSIFMNPAPFIQSLVQLFSRCLVMACVVMLRGGLHRGGNRVFGGSAFRIARRIDMAIPHVKS